MSVNHNTQITLQDHPATHIVHTNRTAGAPIGTLPCHSSRTPVSNLSFRSLREEESCAALLRFPENALYRWLPYLGPRAFLVLLAVLSLRERREWRVRQGLEAKDSEWIEASMSEVGALVGLSAHSVRTALDTPALRGVLRYQAPSPHAHKTDGRGMCPGRWLVTPNALTPADAAALERALTERDALHDFVGAAEHLMAEKRQAAKLLPMLWRVRGWKRGRREGVPTWPASQEDREKAAKGPRPLTVMEVVRSAAGKHGMDEVELNEVNKLENWYVGGVKSRFGVIGQIQLIGWVRELGPGPAVLLLLLRRLAESGRGAEVDEDGRVSVRIPGGAGELAAALGCRRNVVDWWLDGGRALRGYATWGRYSPLESGDRQEYRLVFHLSEEVAPVQNVRYSWTCAEGGRPKPASLFEGGRPKPASLFEGGRPKPASLLRGGSSKTCRLITQPSNLEVKCESDEKESEVLPSLGSEAEGTVNLESEINSSSAPSPVELLKEIETAFRANVETDQPSLEATPQNGGAGWVGLDQALSTENESIIENLEGSFENETGQDDDEELDEETLEDEAEEPGLDLGEEWERDEEESSWDLNGLLGDCFEINRTALVHAGVTAEQWVGLLLQYGASPGVEKPYNLAVKRLLENPRLRPERAYAELGKLPPGKLLMLLTPRELLERGRIGPEYIELIQLEERMPGWKQAMGKVERSRLTELHHWLAAGLCWEPELSA